ncbi:phosphotransferase family protein [Mycolicibacterium litorale]|uniref:phosphotransferase family protein n=1 Tax=Mycolicibacterium litorale TaxID=758802 RepID=UPI003CF8282B
MHKPEDNPAEQHWGIDLAALDAVVSERLGTDGLHRELLGGGLSQTTFRYTGELPAHGGAVIVRIPPLHGPLEPYSASGEAALSEWLNTQGIPVPEVIASAAHEPRIDRGYLIAELVDGYVVSDGAPGIDDAAKTVMAHAYVDQLVALHGLADVTRPVAALEWAPPKTARGVVERWTRSLAETGLELPDFHVFLTDWLVARMPEDAGAHTVVHGDYRLGNVMWSAPQTIAAVLDWEEAGAGDPYFDLGWTLMGTVEPHDLMMGVLRRDEFLARYADKTGNPIDERRLVWWEVAAGWSRICMEAKAIALLSSGHYSDLRPLLSCYINRRLSIVLLEKIRAFEGSALPIPS